MIGEEDKPITVLGASWHQDGHFRSPPFCLLEAGGMGWWRGQGCIRIQKLSLKLGYLALDGLLP